MESFKLDERQAAEEAAALEAFNNPDDPLGGLEPPAFTTQLKPRPDLSQMIQKVMSGQIPRSRELKAWEPDYLDERHINAIMLRAAGMPQGEIARITGYTESWLSIVLNHPDAQYLLAKVLSLSADAVLDVKAKIAAVSGEMLQRVIDITRSTNDEKLASKNAFDLLALAGFTPVQKVETKSTSISATGDQLSELTAAIREARDIKALEVAVIPAPEGSVRRGREVPAQAAISGSQSTDTPSISDGQALPQTRVA